MSRNHKVIIVFCNYFAEKEGIHYWYLWLLYMFCSLCTLLQELTKNENYLQFADVMPKESLGSSSLGLIRFMFYFIQAIKTLHEIGCFNKIENLIHHNSYLLQGHSICIAYFCNFSCSIFNSSNLDHLLLHEYH